MDYESLKLVNEDLKKRFEERTKQHEEARPRWIKAARNIQRYWRGYLGRKRFRAKKAQYNIDCIPHLLARIERLERMVLQLSNS